MMDGSRGRPSPPTVPRLHVITDDGILERADLLDLAARLVVAGGPGLALHLRGPRTSGARLWELASALVPMAGESGAILLVNDRIDVALAARAQGVHLGGRSLPLTEVRRILPPGMCVGVSTHAPGEAAVAARDGADFAFVGTVWEAPSHSGRAAAGPEVVLAAVRAVPALPILAIGGVTEERVTVAREAGAYGVAVIRGVWATGDPVDAMMRYLQVLDRSEMRTEVTDLGARRP